MNHQNPGRRGAVLAGVMAVFLATGSAGAAAERKPDLADAAAGAYAGDVISDSQGSSKSGVALTVTRVGPNTVSIASDYPRLPVVSVPLMAAMGKIVQRNGDSAFVLDRSNGKLDLSFNNQVSWSGQRR